MNKRILYTLPLVLALLALAAPLLTGVHIARADDETTKITVLNTYNFTALSSYMYNATAGKLEAVNSSYVQVLSDEIKDLSAGDNIQPAVVLDLSAPTQDLNTNESITYAYLLSGTYGDLVVGVADVNTTDNSVSNLQLVKVSPVSGDVAIVRTSSDITIYANGVKLSIPLANYTNPRVLVMTPDDASYLAASTVQEVELRAVRNPPTGFALIRSGSGPAEFTISASGPMRVWFDEAHDSGDADLFIFDSSNPSFSSASTSQSWTWLWTHATAHIYSDFAPETRTITAHGQVKFVVQMFRGNSVSQWRVAVRLLSSNNPQPEPTQTPSQPSTTPTTTTNQQINEGALASLRNAYEQNPGLFIIAVLLFLAFIVLLLRR